MSKVKLVYIFLIFLNLGRGYSDELKVQLATLEKEWKSVSRVVEKEVGDLQLDDSIIDEINKNAKVAEWRQVKRSDVFQFKNLSILWKLGTINRVDVHISFGARSMVYRITMKKRDGKYHVLKKETLVTREF